MSKNKSQNLENTFGSFIFSTIENNSAMATQCLNKLLLCTASPKPMKILAKEIKKIYFNGTYPSEKEQIIKDFCAIDMVRTAIDQFANESSDIAWLKLNFVTSDASVTSSQAVVQLSQANEQIILLQTQLSSFQREHDAQITRYEKQIADAQNELEKARLQAEKTAADAEDQIDHLLDELNETKQFSGADSTARIEALESDLTLSKRKIKKLEAEINDMKATASEYTVSNIIAGIGPSLNELLQYPAIARAGRLDEDAVTGMESALQTILDGLADEGVNTIGPVGSKAGYDPAMHHCDRHIAGGTPVIIKAPGYTVNGQVIIPAYVEVKEED